MTFAFKRKSISLLTAKTKESLFLQLERVIPDILFIDIIFGTEDGMEICKDIKQHKVYKDIPVILMSGNPVQLQKFRDCFANDILAKPFLFTELVSKIEEHTKN